MSPQSAMSKPLTIQVSSPCAEDWAAMRPSGEGRHCAHCEKTVVDLSRMTRSQAERLIRGRDAEMCVRLAEDERGEAVFRAERRRLPILSPLALAGFLAACAPEPALEAAPDELEQTLEPETPDGLALDASSTSFGGSLATGVMMPMAPTSSVPITQVAPPEACPLPPEGEPTPEQIALTRRKQRQRQVSGPARGGPIVHHTMGVMVRRDP